MINGLVPTYGINVMYVKVWIRFGVGIISARIVIFLSLQNETAAYAKH